MHKGMFLLLLQSRRSLPTFNIHHSCHSSNQPSALPSIQPSNPNDETPYYCSSTNFTNAKQIVFDSDSFPVGVDCHASCCMSPSKDDFITNTLVPAHSTVRPYQKGADLNVTHKGTLKWNISDDFGRVHKVQIPNSLLVPDGRQRLLSPQHWASEQLHQSTSNKYDPDSIYSTQYHNRNILKWGPTSQFQKTVYNNRRSNVPVFYTAPGINNYKSYMSSTPSVSLCQEFECQQCAVCHPATIIPSNEPTDLPTDLPSSVAPPVVSDDENDDTSIDSTASTSGTEENIIDFMPTSDTSRPPSATSINNDATVSASTDEGELLRWHLRLGHLSFNKLQALAQLNVIPRRLAKVRHPKCAQCIYGKMHRKPWRTRKQPSKVNKATKLGQCISVDQLEAPK